ncbi:glycosyltransferase [bacterium]|nr:glycosyltransferase [bacterium]
MRKKILVLAAPFPRYNLTGFRDWLLEGKSPSGMPAIVSFLRESYKLGHEVHITLPVFERNIKCKSFVHEDHLIVHPYRLPSFFLLIIYILLRKGSFLLDHFFALITLIYSFGFHKRLLSRLHPHFIYQMGFNIVLGYFLHKSSERPLINRYFGTHIWKRLKPSSNKKISLWQGFRNFPEIFNYSHYGNLVVMVNDGTRGDKVLEVFGVPEGKILFLLNGLDLEDNESCLDIRSMFPPDVFLVVAMARLVSWKGIDRILRALPEAFEYVPELKLVVIGDGRQRKMLESLAETLGVSSAVRFVGHVSHTKAVNTLKQADLFISVQYLSNLSNCLLEAILAGLPIISLADGSLDGLLEDGEDSVLLDPHNVERELPQTIKKLARNKTFYRHLRRGIKKKREEIWTWHDRISFELRTIERIISKGKQ